MKLNKITLKTNIKFIKCKGYFNKENIENAIQEMENRYSFVFPAEYRMFLQKYNGGKTPDTTFYLRGISSDIQAFYGLAKADLNYNISMIENTPLFLDFKGDL